MEAGPSPTSCSILEDHLHLFHDPWIVHFKRAAHFFDQGLALGISPRFAGDCETKLRSLAARLQTALLQGTVERGQHLHNDN